MAIDPGIIKSAPTLREVTSEYARLVYEATGLNKTRASEILGINVVTLYRLAKKWEDGGPGAMETELGGLLLESIQTRAALVDAQDTLEALLDRIDQRLRRDHVTGAKGGREEQAAGDDSAPSGQITEGISGRG